MTAAIRLFFALFVSLALAVVWFFYSERVATTPALQLPSPAVASGVALQAVLPLAPLPALDPLRVALGERLFHDPRLSADSSISCASCHDLTQGGADGRKVSVGVNGKLGSINSPTVLNSAYSLAQFWDGRAISLEEQVAGPLHNPVEMASSWSQAIARLEQDPDVVEAFRRIYPDGLTSANIADAIATFERSLVTLNSRFDRYLKGEKQILTALEVEGYRRFQELGCTSCHQGALLGGNMFQKFGVLGDYFAGRSTTEDDLGRYNVTKRDEDRHVFKVPGLRNVAMTAPYFHDGSVDTLEQAVAIMARYQLGRDLSADDVATITAFLKTLSGDLPAGRS